MSINKIITRLTILMLFFANISRSQTDARMTSDPRLTYLFPPDSLRGFDEELAKKSAFEGGYYGDEFKVFLYNAKRSFINAKYNIRENSASASSFKDYVPPTTLSAACLNDDFEAVPGASAPGILNITTTTGIPGWTTDRGNNTNSCITPTFPNPPNEVAIIGHTSAAGYIDAQIGASYPIFSVFGSTLSPNSGTTVAGNATITPNMYGNYFVRINDQNPGTNEERISRCFSVTPQSALYQFAFMTVVDATGHTCCGQPSFHINLYNGCSGPLIACPQFSATVPGAFCTPSSTLNYPQYQSCPANPSYTYCKWKVASIDLTAYIGLQIKVEVIMTDCNGGAHAGYMYFDSQCAPMDIIGNGTNFPAGSTNITLPTCGAGSSATITAPPGLGPYQWTGPTGFVPSSAQTITTNITGNYTLTMNPIGSCTPTIKTVSVVISPAPNLAVSGQTNVSCTSSTNAISVTMASGIPNTTATPQYTVTFSPTAPTGTTGVSANTATYTGLAAGINTITLTDAVGCINTVTVNVPGAIPVPSFSISTPSGTVIGCNPSTVPLNAVNTSTVSPLNYTWTSISTGTQTGSSINASAPTGTNTYVVFAQGAGSCLVTQTVTVIANTGIPSITITPITRTLTCNGAPACFTAVCSPTTNVQGQWFDPTLTPIGGLSNSPVLMCTGTPGIYTFSCTNITNGCVVGQTVAVNANTVVPTMTVNSLQGNTITCNNPCLIFNITASPGPAPKSYSWTSVTTSVTTTPPTGGYTICTPGNYVAEYMDGNMCRISQTITIIIDTLRPTPLSMTDLPSNSYTLSCYNPSLVATGYSNPLLSPTNYSWTIPPNLTVASNTIGVTTVSVTANPTTFTVLAKGNNGCVGKQKVLFYKDVTVPPYTAIFTPSAITCVNPFVAMSPQSTSSSTIPVTFTFTSPAPTTTNNASGSQFGIPGTYTMAYTNTQNGCSATTTTVVPINVVPPSTVALTPTVIPCGTTTVGLNAGLTIQQSSYTYTWYPPSNLAGMSCASCYSTSTNMTGEYEVVITNTINGCTASNAVTVSSGSLVAGFTPDVTEGFSPLSVNFANTTALGSSAAGGSITTTWSYGNGITYSVTNANSGGTPNGATIYQSAGTYTVLLVVTQAIYSGTTTLSSCVATATNVIKVELPSEVIIPNVFTPNGDGANDVFMIQSTSLTNISVQIFDRWGVKMYDMTSEKNQIGWDGKNLAGKEVPSGTYFYMLKASGKDGTDYSKQGTVSLYR